MHIPALRTPVTPQPGATSTPISSLSALAFCTFGRTVEGVVRIHYAIPDQLHRRAKAAAALKGISLKEYVVDALERATQVAEHRPSKRDQ